MNAKEMAVRGGRFALTAVAGGSLLTAGLMGSIYLGEVYRGLHGGLISGGMFVGACGGYAIRRFGMDSDVKHFARRLTVRRRR